VTFQACNPHPRFWSRPDCYDYDLQVDAPELQAANGCIPGLVKLAVAGPTDRADELIARAQVASGLQKADQVELRLERIIGSMGNTFKAAAGTVLGTISLANGAPNRFDLGPGLLPSEIGARSASVLIDQAAMPHVRVDGQEAQPATHA